MAGHVKVSWVEPGDVRARSAFGVPWGQDERFFTVRLDDGRMLKIAKAYLVKVEDCEAGYHG